MGTIDRVGNINEWFVSETGQDTEGGRSETGSGEEQTTEGEVW